MSKRKMITLRDNHKLSPLASDLIQMIVDIDYEHPVLLALLQERIETMMSMTIADIEQNPKAWEVGFVHPRLYTQLNEIIKHSLNKTSSHEQSIND